MAVILQLWRLMRFRMIDQKNPSFDFSARRRRGTGVQVSDRRLLLRFKSGPEAFFDWHLEGLATA
jgi:hypothetical protein